jgi:hypothetical protein
MVSLTQDNRTALMVSDDNGANFHTFTIAPTGRGGRGLVIMQRPWEPGDPQKPFRIPLHPWMGGLRRDRLKQLVGVLAWRRESAGYAKGNLDAFSVPGIVLPPPLLNSLTFTNATLPNQAVFFDGVLYVLGGRYVYAIDSSYSVTEDKDFGSGKAGLQMTVFNKELVVAMGETEKLWTRSLGAYRAGTANAAVTTDNTTLTDTRLSLTVNAYVGATVTCNSKTMVVTSNTATVFTGASWSGGSNPGNGNAWSVTGTWTQASDATYAIAVGTVGNAMWRAESTNLLSNCITAPRTLTSYAPTTAASKYRVGDTTYPVLNITDFGGIPWVGKADGLYAPDNEAKFRNQCPQLASYPHADNTKGIFLGQGALWCPSASGLLRVRSGESVKLGPEITLRPDYRFWVRGGVEWAGALYIVVNDQSAVEKTFVCRMERDAEGLTPNEYRYHEFVRAAGTDVGYFIGMLPNAANPSVVFGYGNNGKYFKLGRGGGADTDDPNYAFGTETILETGLVTPAEDSSMRSCLLGVETLCDFSAAGETLTIQYAVDEGSTYYDLTATSEYTGGATIALTDGYETIRRYAPPGTIGQFYKFKFTGALTSATGTDRPEIREAWAFGYLRPRMTDQISVAIVADGGIGTIGNRDTDPGYKKLDLWRKWGDEGTVLVVKLNDYEEGRVTRFIVNGVKALDVDTSLGTGGGLSTSYQVQVELVRTDFAAEYARE